MNIFSYFYEMSEQDCQREAGTKEMSDGSGYLQDFLQLALWSQPQDLLRLLNAQHPAGSALRRFCNKTEIKLNWGKDDEKREAIAY